MEVYGYSIANSNKYILLEKIMSWEEIYIDGLNLRI